MSDDDGFPDPGQMTTGFAAPRAAARAQRVRPDEADDAVGRDAWPDPGQGTTSARAGRSDPAPEPGPG